MAKKQLQKSNRIILFSVLALILVVVLSAMIFGLRNSDIITKFLANNSKQKINEIAESDYDTQDENVKFMAYFLNNNQKVDGTYNQIGYNDTLYFDISVEEGQLENAKITIDSQNFYLETNLMSDSLISQDYVSNNTKEIVFNNVAGPISRTFEGSVKSGDYKFTTTKTDAIGKDISNYNKVNTITFTADYVDSSGKPTSISKTVDLSVGWYGKINCEIPEKVYGNNNLIQKYNISDYLNSETGTMTIEFKVATQETGNEVLIKKSYIEGTIPDINGYQPTEVVVEGESVQFTYDFLTKKFIASREATVTDNVLSVLAYSGTYAQNEVNYRYNEYTIKATYSIEAYQTDDDEYINLDVPVIGHYEGFNGEKSDDVTATINVSYSNLKNEETGFSASVGRSVLYPEARQIVSKENVLLGYQYSKINDIESTYYTKWNILTSQRENASSVVLSDNSVEDKFITTEGTTIENNGYITNKGIAFSNPVSALGQDGWIRVYDAESGELLHEFTSADWANYDTLNPYEYGKDVKYIKIETSEIVENSFVIVYNIKSFNISKIKQDFTEEEVNNLEFIESSFSGSMTIEGRPVTYVTKERASFEEELSILNFQVSDGEISTQGSNNITLEIDPNTTQYNSSRWNNEEYLIKFPSDIINVTINDIRTNIATKEIKNYYQYNENGNIFIKIEMGADSINDYELLLNCVIQTNPNATSKTSDVELYAYNEKNNKFYKNDMSQDIYDVNDNSNKEELVGKKSDSISIISPETLLTSQSTSNATNEGETIYAPLTAIVENENRTATVDIELINNHSNAITDVKVLGTLPFKGNKYHLTDEELGSTYTSELTSDGIIIPESLARYATIYYSEHEEVNDDTTDTSNGWTQTVSDYTKVRSFLIVFNRYEIQPDEELKISYNIKIPENIQYNEIAYSTHTVYYSEHNGSEISRKTAEVNKLGFMIAKRVDLEVSNYSLEGKNIGIEGVKFLLTETGDREQSTILTSNEEGKVNFTNLLLERTYKLKEIGVPDDYVINDNEVTFRTYEENGEIKLELNGSFADEPTINQEEKKIYASLYNEVRYDLSITNLNNNNAGIISTFKLEGGGKTIEEQTDEHGNLILEGLYPEEEYTLTQTYSKGYYIEDNNQLTFKLTRGENGLQIESNKDGILSINKEEGTIKPVVNYAITNETIPTYNLTVTLYERDTNIALEDAEYKITGGGKESGETYTTDSKGQFTIPDLYTYVDGKNETAEYVLKQITPTIGYTLSSNDIKFVVSRNPDTQELTLTVEEGEIRVDYTIQGNNVSIALDAKKIFSITTIDGETVSLLPGVKLAISELSIIDNQEVETEPMDESGNVLGQEEIINGKPCRVFITNEDGIIDAPLRDGIYKIVKVEVPEGYVLEENEADRTYYVGIGETRGASVEAIFRDPTELQGSGNSNPSDFYVAGRDDGIGLFYHRGQLTLLDEESNPIKSISSNAVSQIIDDNGTFVVLEDSRIVKYNDNLDVIAQYNLTSGMDKFAVTPDGGYVVVGSFTGTKDISARNTASGSDLSIESVTTTNWFWETPTEDVFVMKVNSEGKVESITNVGGTGADMATYVTVTTSGDYVVSSHMTSSSISGDMMSDGRQESGDFDDCYFVMDKDTMKINQIVSVGTARGDVEATEGNAHRAFAGNDGGIYYVGQMSGTVRFSGDETESGRAITVTSTGDTDAYIAKFNSEGKVVWAIAVGGGNTDHIYSAEYTPDGELLIGGDSNGGAITVDGSKTSSGLDIVSSPVGDSASTWRGIALKVDSQGRVVWVNEFGYAANEGIYAFAGFTGNSYVICGFNDNDNNINNGREDVYIRVDEAENRAEISEVEGIEIQNTKKRYNITTSVTGEGGTITGQELENLEEVVHGENSTIPITITPNEGYEILAITVNGEMIPFTPDENKSVTLPIFENVTEDINIVAQFSNNTSRIVVHHYLEGTIDTRIAEDDILVGTVGTEYTTGPKIGLIGYELAKNDDGSYKVDGNTSGVYDEFDKEIIYYYVATPVRVIVNHFIEGTNISLSPTIEYEYEKGQTYTTNIADDIPEEYELVKVPSNATGIIEEPEIVVTYYYRLKPMYNYTVEYYYDGEKDYSLTETLQAIAGKTIDTYPTKQKEGYVFDKTENLPLIVSTDETQNVIKVYYKAREDLSYKVEYYYDGKIDEEKTAEFSNVKFGTIITEYEDKVIEGYQLERVENTPLTVGVNSEENIIKVYYTIRKDLYYTVNYFEQNTINKIIDSKEVAGNTYHSVITEYPVDISGYNKVSGDPQSITIEVDEQQNVINFYYTKRNDLTYTVNYYEQGTQEKVANSKVVENQTFKDSVTEYAIDVTGYYKVEPTEQTIEIGVENNVINFYYQKRTDINYRVEYYYDNVIDASLTENYTATFKDVINTYTDKVKNAYELDRTENLPLTITANEDTNVIRVYYVRVDASIIENTIQKTATDKITVEDQRVNYTLTYTGKLENYIGNATITIVDTLPYAIDEANSDTAKGNYDANSNTITWTENVENIDTYTDESTGNINITKQFSVTYVNMDYSKSEIINKANAKINLNTTGQEINVPEAQATTRTEFTKDVTVRKVWNHTNNEYNIPKEVIVQVKNGDEVVNDELINESYEVLENVWEYTFNDLPKYDNQGQEINYTADEAEANSGDLDYYNKVIDGNTITNTYVGPIITANKTVSGQREDGTVKAGDVLTYTITINNTGGTAKEVIVSDQIPDGTTFVQNSIKVNGREAFNTQDELVTGISVNVEKESTATLSFQVTVDDIENGDIISNTAKVDGENTNTVSLNYIEAIIGERKTARTEFGEDYVIKGEKITYTITATNDGDLAKAVLIKDDIPKGSTFVENSIRINDEETTKTLEDLKNGLTVNVPEDGQATISFEVTVNDDATQIVNTAFVDNQPTNEVKYAVVTYEKTSEVVRQTEQELETGELTAGDKIIYTINISNLGTDAVNGIIVEDTIPEGTTVSKINNNGIVNDKDEISWSIANIEGKNKTTVSFEVTIDYDTEETKEITNIALVDAKETNEVTNTYEKPEVKLQSNITKEGTNIITATENKVDYTINYSATVDDFVGDGQVTIVDYLPYKIDISNSDIANGTYDSNRKTITWVEQISVMDTYTNDIKNINIRKDISLKYVYDDEEHLSGNIENRVTGKIDLTQNGTVVKTEEKEDTHQAMAQIPTKVIVHHYIEGTQTKVPSIDDGKAVEDVVIEGYIGSQYETKQADNVDKAYECVSNTQNTTGTMTKQTIEVIYYYKLKESTINANIIKASDTTEVTDLNQKIQYTISYSSTIVDYRGDATLTIIDTLPYEIDEDNSELADGVYDKDAKTITWTEEITGIDTYLNGDRAINRTKQLNLVYEGIDLNEDAIENTVNATLTLTVTGKESLEQANKSIPINFRINKTIEKVWDDNDNLKKRRPTSVTVYLTADGTRVAGRSATLSASNEWKVTFENLPKYSNDRKEINYSAEETETNVGDLEYYESPVIENLDNIIKITNQYKLMESDLNSSIDVTGTNSITSSKSKVSYNIKYNATVENYIGEALVTIVVQLPYAIDKDLSNIAGGAYDSEAKTITWTQKVDHINTYENGNYVATLEKEIQLVFSNLEATKDNMKVEVEGKIDLYETETTNTVKDSHVTSINIPGKVVVKYIDILTGSELAQGYEINGKVGEHYDTVQKEIYGCKYIEHSGNVSGELTEDTIYVTYYYERIESAPIIVKYIDEYSAEEIATRETITGYIGDSYETVQKEIENYDFVRVEGETSGELSAEKKEVVYVYKKIPARVIVKYLEKDDTETNDDNTELAEETIMEGFSGDKYITERKEVEGYVKADPEPANAEGVMGRGDTYVIYYYERQQSGKVRAKYVDVDTGKEILYVDSSTGEVKTYREELEGYVGDDYTTAVKEIPYYTYLEDKAPTNGVGKYTVEDIEVIYYYKKQVFNMSVQTEIANIKLNGTNKHVVDGDNKVEIYRKSAGDTQLEVTFRVLVSNTEEIEGTATVVDTLPQYFEIAEETSSEWRQTQDGQLKARVDLAPGETKELIIVLKWIPGQSNFGDLVNIVELEDVVNPANYTETTEEDNKSTADLVVSISTGENRSLTNVLVELAILIVIAGVIVLLEKKLKNDDN